MNENKGVKKIYAKPFVKWAGGKRQLLDRIIKTLPADFEEKPYTYIEPFVGGGALLFKLLGEYTNIKKAIINDINSDLINVYKIIKNNVEELISVLKKIEFEYHSLSDNLEKQKKYYYDKRKQFNLKNNDMVKQAALLIFLNRTCFNGLYRVNKKNEFNVPIGNYKKPMICDENNLFAVSKILEKVIILNGDFEETISYASRFTLFYLDPPYKPLNNTSNFNSYSKEAFNDNDQKRLAKFCENLDRLGYKWILSNSDLKVSNSVENFFDKLYEKFDIYRVKARRNINSNPNKRGELTELLITNFANKPKKEKYNGEKTSIQTFTTA